MMHSRITPAAIISVAPAAKQYVGALLAQMESNEINTPLRAAHFLGQIYVESGGFTATTESLNYRANSDMMKRFIRWGRISAADAQKFGKTADHPAHENALANILYGGDFGRRKLGNTMPGDGWRFRGRSLKQLTGRDNYRRFSLAHFGDERLLTDPDWVATPAGAVAAAVWFWMSRKLNFVADTGDVAAVTLKVNGGDVGLPERREWTRNFLTAFGGK